MFSKDLNKLFDYYMLKADFFMSNQTTLGVLDIKK